MTHDQLQSACWEAAWNHCIKNAPHMLRRFFSIPNSSMGFMGMVKAKQLESCGTLSGVWDFVVFGDDGHVHWIEFKVGNDRVSKAQKKFKDAMSQPGLLNFFYEVRELSKFFTIFNAIIIKDQELLKKMEYCDDKAREVRPRIR